MPFGGLVCVPLVCPVLVGVVPGVCGSGSGDGAVTLRAGGILLVLAEPAAILLLILGLVEQSTFHPSHIYRVLHYVDSTPEQEGCLVNETPTLLLSCLQNIPTSLSLAGCLCVYHPRKTRRSRLVW